MQAEELRAIFRTRVRSRRLELGLTQTEVAKRMGTNQSFIAAMEAGTRAPGLDVVAKFADALNTSPSALLTSEEIFSASS